MRPLRGPFRFNAVTHTYTVGGVTVPGIHAVLRAGGVEQNAPGYTDEARARGKAVHEATLLYDMGETSIILPERWQPFFDAYVKFRSEVECHWRKLEYPRVHRELKYASIVDREGLVEGHASVAEIKTGSPAPFHGPQLAGADMLLNKVRWTRRRLAIYLGQDGRYKLREYDDPADYHRFMQAVRDYWFERDAGGV